MDRRGHSSAATSLTRGYQLSVVAAALLAVTSGLGIAFASRAYPTEELRHALLPNDIVTLVVVVPVLLGSMLLTRGGSLLGLLLWPGALLNGLYGSVALAVATPHAFQQVTYLALAALCGWAMVLLVRGIDHQDVRRHLSGAVPARVGGIVLVALGSLFVLRAGAELLAAGSGDARTAAEVGTAVADLVTAPLLVLGGLLLWRTRALGYGVGTGLLFQASMLFLALLAFFVVQPLVTSAPFAATDFMVVAAMGLVCFVPCGLFLRGVLRAGGGQAVPG